MIYARQMLFISMLFEDPNKMSITDKAKMFLEILGNTKLRASTFEVGKTFSKKPLTIADTKVV
jgi:hypothetical protein